MTLFEVVSKMGKKISTTKEYWDFIVTIKHPIMEGKEKEVQEALKEPDEVRKSKKDKSVYLYYKGGKIITCVVCKHLNGAGFIITAYQTEKIKEGKLVWKK